MYFILNHSTSKGLLPISNLQIRHWGSEPLRDFLVSVVLSGSGHSGNWIWADVCKACVFRAWTCATFSACVRAPGYPGQETCPHFAVSSDWPPAICAFIAPWTCYVLWNLGLFFFPLLFSLSGLYFPTFPLMCLPFALCDPVQRPRPLWSLPWFYSFFKTIVHIYIMLIFRE